MPPQEGALYTVKEATVNALLVRDQAKAHGGADQNRGNDQGADARVDGNKDHADRRLGTVDQPRNGGDDGAEEKDAHGRREAHSPRGTVIAQGVGGGGLLDLELFHGGSFLLSYIVYEVQIGV